MTNIVKIDNPKEHFIRHDGLNNVQYDVTYSVFKKYSCQAGCKICYIGQDFLPQDKFKKYIPLARTVTNNSYIDQLTDFISYFKLAAVIDDLRYVKEEHSDLYQFYLEHSHMFWLSSMTDNAVFRHLPLMDDPLNFIGLREISLSEQFLQKANWRKVLQALDKIQSKAKILKIKLILSAQESFFKKANELQSWCISNAVMLEKQYEHGSQIDNSNPLAVLPNTRHSVSDVENVFSEEVTYSEGFNLYPIHSESIFLQYTDFYSELKAATREDRTASFASLGDFSVNPAAFLAKVLEGKKTDYAKYVEWMKCKDNDYYRYFDYVAKNLVVNHGFNFIPRFVLRPDSVYYNKLLQSKQFIDSKYGLVDPTAKQIIPIYSFKDNEHQ